jgi:CRISPR system Cascade subunit CasD
MSVIKLFLAGSRQCYGLENIGQTKPWPTKSAVAGIVANALGLDYKDTTEFLKDFNKTKVHVRVDSPGSICEDFQVATGFGDANGRARTMKEKVAYVDNGVVKEYNAPKKTMFTPTYLCDARFMVFIEGRREVLETWVADLERPKRPLYLGRSSCLPSENIFVSHEDRDIQELIENSVLELLPGTKYEGQKTLNTIMEVQSGGYFIRDVVLTFKPSHTHGSRMVVQKPVVVKNVVPWLQGVGLSGRRNRPSKKARDERLSYDNNRCVECGAVKDVQYHHVTYENYGCEKLEDARTLCVICHRACTLLNSQFGHFDPRELPEEDYEVYRNVRDQIAVEHMRILESRKQLPKLPY